MVSGIGIWWQDQDFTVEAVHLCDLPALVVSPEQGDAVRPLGFQDQQVGERLQAVIPPVHKVSLRTEKVADGKLTHRTAPTTNTYHLVN